jgi:P27 family predicted phage terminase small subunit
MRGRKPLPRALKDLKAGRASPVRAAGLVSVPDMPDWLDEDAVCEWNRLLPELADRGMLTVFDMAAFAMYCQCWSQIKDATIRLRMDGMVVKGSTGQDRVNPLAQHIKELYVQLRAYATEFGFTPSSRARVDISGGDTEDDDMEEMLDANPRLHIADGEGAHGGRPVAGRGDDTVGDVGYGG